MAFQPKGYGIGGAQAELELVLLADSASFSVGEAIEAYSTGYGKNPVKAKPALGIIVGFVNQYGAPLQPTAYSAGSATSTDVQSVTTTSSNVSGQLIWALVNTSVTQKYSVTVNGTVNTTTNSGRGHLWVSVDSDNTSYGRVLESLCSRTAVKEWYVVSTDSSDTTRFVVQLAGSEKLASALTP